MTTETGVEPSLYSHLFGGIFSTLEEYPGIANSELYNRAVKMLDNYLRGNKLGGTLEDELVNWVNSPVLDDLKEDSSFENMCRKGHINIAEWYLKKYPLEKNEDILFLYACIGGHLDCVKWFLEKFPQTDVHYTTIHTNLLPEEVRKVPKFSAIENEIPFRCCCASRNTELIDWFLKKYPETNDPADEFYTACDREDLELAKYLCSRLISEDVKIFGDDCLLEDICERGNLELVKWILEKFPETELHEYHVSRSSNTELCEFVMTRLLQPVQNPKEILFNACKGGHIEMIEWVLGKFPHLENHAINNLCFSYLFEYGKIDTMNWFLERFPETDVKRAITDQDIEEAIYTENYKTLRWFFERYPETEIMEADRGFISLCLKNDVEYAKKLVVKILDKSVPEQFSKAPEEWLFSTVCSNGNLDLIKWFLDQAPSLDLLHSEGLRTLCWEDNIKAVKWLMKKFPRIDSVYVLGLLKRFPDGKISRWLSENSTKSKRNYYSVLDLDE